MSIENGAVLVAQGNSGKLYTAQDTASASQFDEEWRIRSQKV